MYDLVQMLWSESEITDKQLDHLLDVLQKRVVEFKDMPKVLKKTPSLIVLRNCFKAQLNLHLAKVHASNLGVRFCMWRCTDIGANGKRLSKTILKTLESIPYKHTAKMPTIQCFFPGIRYILLTMI